MKIELVICPSGDWYILKAGGNCLHAGHSIPDFAWIELLQLLGHDISETEISDEEMEENPYG